MARFLIEIPHDESTVGCAQAVAVFLRSGSHFLTHADWGCKDDEHKAWIVVEVDTKSEARGVVPPLYRAQAKIVELTTYTMKDVDEILRNHKP